ncbi:unnamed protein product [Blepharisma stoltei]|uniref:Kelch motif family protein n=1 Tax=Blepharisma stoltei TaxID=1481888 RepID=A0AAU9JCW4_9CILI|nr:unnamed protein product [Blepharisma stoltei]
MEITCRQFEISQLKEIERSNFNLFTKGSSDLIEVNLDDFSKTHHKLSIPEICLDERICICPLPDGKYFCYGNIAKIGQASGITFIVNQKNEILNLPAWTSILGCFPIYLENCVYVFGGEYVERFNLIKWKWEKIIKFPPKCRLCTCALIGKKILFSGYSFNGIFLLDLLTLSFSWHSLETLSNKAKLLCNVKNTIYLVDFSGKIFQSEIGNPFIWSFEGNFQPLRNSTPENKIFYKNCIYFTIGNQIFKFDLTKKNVQTINFLLDQAQAQISQNPNDDYFSSRF